MTRSSTFIFIFVAVFAFCFITSSTAQQAADFQQDELIQFLNSRYPNLYNRALRSMGKPTFIRFGKRSSASAPASAFHQQQPQYPFEQLQQSQQQQWTQ
uniref:Uncharacterized protein n=1 Tax=Panagrolaimus sp. PS1159 TaxID=55785 RepID=A0AC35FCX9_9BILA